MTVSLTRRLAAEFLGTAFLVAAVVGSGIMGETLANGNVALALLANTIATGAALIALILAFGPHLWGSLESRRELIGCAGKRTRVGRGRGLHLRSGVGRSGWRNRGAFDVRLAVALAVASRSERACAGVQRVCRNVRTAFGYMGMLPLSFKHSRLRSR